MLVDLETYRTETAKMKADAALVQGLRVEAANTRRRLELARERQRLDSVEVAACTSRLTDCEATAAATSATVEQLRGAAEQAQRERDQHIHAGIHRTQCGQQAQATPSQRHEAQVHQQQQVKKP